MRLTEDMSQEELADLCEAMVPIVSELAVAVRDDGVDTVGKILDRVPDSRGAVALVVAAAMINPDVRMRQLLGWTETMTPPPLRGKPENDPPAERERQRLVAAGVDADLAIQLAATFARPVKLPAPGALRHLHVVTKEEAS